MEVARRPKRAIAKVTHPCVTQPVEAAERARCGTLHGMPSSSIFRVILVGCASFVLVACRSESAPEPVRSEPKTETTATPEKPASKTAPTKRTLGVAIADGAGQKAALSDVAKAPAGYLDKKLVTEGTITAVCQHKGCWMEIRDASLGGEAHVKMVGKINFYWCPHHGFWTAHKPEDCTLATTDPGEQKPEAKAKTTKQTEKKVSFAAASRQIIEGEDETPDQE